MASHPPEQNLLRESAAPDGLAQSWSDLHRHARDLAVLAEITPEPEADDVPIAALMQGADDWQCQLAVQGVDDIAFMLETGLTALATLSARGQDGAAPALALWREFHAARAVVLSVLHAEPVA